MPIRWSARSSRGSTPSARSTPGTGCAAGPQPRPAGPEASLGKLMASQIARLWRETATLVCGPAAMLAGPDGPLDGQVALQALAAPGPAIYGGSDQIQRNVIGERVLGLP